MFQKSMHAKCCAIVKSYWWHMEKTSICWENYVTQHEVLTQVFKKE